MTTTDPSISPRDLPVGLHEEAMPDGASAFRENHRLIRELTSLPEFRKYEAAFTEITGLPLALRPLETWHLAHHEHDRENPFCGLIASRSRSCAACLSLQDELCEAAREEMATRTCPFGLTESAVPVRVDQHVIGFLQTGQVVLDRVQEPSEVSEVSILRRLDDMGLGFPEAEVLAAYRSGQRMGEDRYEAIVRLLSTFAEQLGLLAQRVMTRQSSSEPRVVRNAKRYILEHQEEDLSLGDVARAVHVSSFYLCKLFKRSTGMNFTEYLSRIRVEHAQRLLLNPEYRVGDIGLQVGFQSLTHFNRMFKKLVGESPTRYRSRLRAFSPTSGRRAAGSRAAR